MRCLINDASLVVGQLLDDPLQYFSWAIYAGAGVLYTAFAFSGELSKEGALIFSKRNARSLSSIFIIHASFLVILLGLIWVVPVFYPSLPNWMTDLFPHRNPPLSPFDIVFILAMIGLSYVERQKLFVEVDADPDVPKCDSSEPSGFRKG